LVEHIDADPRYIFPGTGAIEEKTTPVATMERPDPAKVMNQIRKWGCHFDGKDPLAFLERVEELRVSYDYTEDQLLLGLPELLRGNSLLWYQNCQESWISWVDFERSAAGLCPDTTACTSRKRCKTDGKGPASLRSKIL